MDALTPDRGEIVEAQRSLNRDEIDELNREFEDAHPSEILAWAHKRFGDSLVVTSSFGDSVLAHLAWTTIPDIEVVMLDTGYLFAETHWYAQHAAELFGGAVRIVAPDAPPDNLWLDDTDACCAARKVAPLERLLVDHTAWVTGLRRDDGPTRATAPIVSNDLLRNAVKINPIAAWTDLDVDSYTIEHCLPVNPLTGRGFTSIGCWPCTRAPRADGDDRSGRWAGTDKTECGLHMPPPAG
jgi:phosphoadenosine phosphosulfate reductase